MVKFQLRGILASVSMTETTNNGKEFVRCLIVKPGFVNEFGEKKGEDQTYEVTFFGEKAGQVTFIEKESKVSLECLLSCKPHEYGGKLYYNPQILGQKIEKL